MISPKHIHAVLWSSVSLLILSASLPAKEIALYVSPEGNDAWSGRPVRPNIHQTDGPLATLPAALAATRKARMAAKPGDHFSLYLRSGTYEIVAPLVLTPEDSGQDAKHPFTIAAYQHEKPVISGGTRITGWRPVAGKPGWWSAVVPGVKEGQWYFRQLFVNGERRQRARTPNDGFFRIQGESPQEKPVKLKFKPGDIKPEWAADGDVEVVAFLAWGDLRMQIRNVDEVNHVAILSGNAAESNRENDAQYWIENAADALDLPGEWYLSRKTGVIIYRAKPGEDISKAIVIAPRPVDLLRLEGDFSAKQPVRQVVVRGLTFAYTDWTLSDRGYADVQAAYNIHGNVSAQGAVDCVVTDCRFEHLGGYAVELGRGCQRVSLRYNEMRDLGAGGIRVGEPLVRGEVFDRNFGHEITDNHLHDLGQVYKPACGIIVLQSGQNRIAHNHIHDLYYTAISVGWNWGYQETPCRENIVEFNHLHDIGKGVLSDMGAIYTLGIQKGTVIRNNFIHDVNAFTYGGWGIYPDEGSTSILIENNVVCRTKSAGFHQHYGRDNVVRNNIFALGREHQLMRSRSEPHLSFTFTNNIVYFNSGDLLGSNWKEDRYVMDRNLYWDARPGFRPGQMQWSGATLDQWRQRGHDVHSMVADPQLANPERLDFRLKPGSPAIRLGFKPIDLRTVGVRKKT